jgi:hypothetical protein
LLAKKQAHPTYFLRLENGHRGQARSYRVKAYVLTFMISCPGGLQALYFAVGMLNSAPLAMLSGQRCMTLL